MHSFMSTFTEHILYTRIDTFPLLGSSEHGRTHENEVETGSDLLPPPRPPPPVSGMCADNRGYLLSERGQDGYPSFVFGGLNLTGSWRRNWRGKETAKLVTIIVLINVRSLP